jgi:hypothetical protein
MSKTFGIFTPRNHEEYAARYQGRSEQDLAKTRAQFEDVILARKSWRRSDPEFEMHLAAGFLASVGELGGPDSRLGATRENALQSLRRRLTKAHMIELEEMLEDYDLSAPHPRHRFGPGWTDADAQRAAARTTLSEEQQGATTMGDFEAERASHWYYRVIDWLPPRSRLAYAVSIARRWRWMRYAL